MFIGSQSRKKCEALILSGTRTGVDGKDGNGDDLLILSTNVQSAPIMLIDTIG